MGFYEAWHGAVDRGGEEVWDFMRLGMAVRSTGGQLHAPCQAIFPIWPKMSLKCLKCA